MSQNDHIHTETPVGDRLAKRTLAPPTPSLLDAPLPTPQSAARPPAPPVLDADAGPQVKPALGIGGFFAQHKSLVDERRHHLARLGMMERHVDALRMPDLDEAPQAPAVLAEDLPPVNQAGKPEPKKARQRPEGGVW